MAVTAKDGRDREQPTSWSAAVDALAAGRSFDPTEHGTRYALVISIETDAVDADIWTPIANQVDVSVAVES
jgi:hypothetical protein